MTSNELIAYIDKSLDYGDDDFSDDDIERLSEIVKQRNESRTLRLIRDAPTDKKADELQRRLSSFNKSIQTSNIKSKTLNAFAPRIIDVLKRNVAAIKTELSGVDYMGMFKDLRSTSKLDESQGKGYSELEEAKELIRESKQNLAERIVAVSRSKRVVSAAMRSTRFPANLIKEIARAASTNFLGQPDEAYSIILNRINELREERK